MTRIRIFMAAMIGIVSLYAHAGNTRMPATKPSTANVELVANGRFLEGHEGGLLYYANVLQKYHYDWLVAGAAALLLFPIPWSALRARLQFWRDDDETRILLWAWAAVTVLVPTLMRTKNAWYLQPFYPAFALGIAWLLARGLVDPPETHGWRRRRTYLAVVVVMAFLVAEGRLVVYSHAYRDLSRSTQGLLLAERRQLAGHQVFGDRWNYAELFVLRALVGAEHRTAPDADAFLRESGAGSYFMSAHAIDRPELEIVGSNRRYWLYRRQDNGDDACGSVSERASCYSSSQTR